MVELIAPNGGLFEASDEAATALLANGWNRYAHIPTDTAVESNRELDPATVEKVDAPAHEAKAAPKRASRKPKKTE